MNSHSFLLTALAAAIILAGCTLASDGPEDRHRPAHLQVDPFIGTGGHGHTYPGPTRPFGMVQLSPDTRLTGWDGCSGYHFSDDTIFGFSHTHLQGTGVSDYGDILFMPCTQFADGNKWRDRYKSAFRKETETAHAGHYQVTLDDHELLVELTATERVGIHQYVPLGRDSVTLIVDLDHRDELTAYSIYPLDDSTLVGHRVSDNWAKEQHVYFAARFSQTFSWLDALSEVTVTGREPDGTLLQEVSYVPVFAADFGAVDTLIARVAMSFVDIEGALSNLEAEAPHTDFARYRSDAESAWDEQLNRIEIEGGTTSDQTIFRTALYHSCTTPNLASDVDGRYRGTDLQVHTLPAGETHYTIFSLWDTFRALHPLLNWVEPNRSRDFIRTFLRMYEEGGQLPVWELAANYTGCMIGYHSVPVIVDAWSWGVRDFDEALALEAMVHSADREELGLGVYAGLGYIPMEAEHESVSKTLEYAFDDACIANFAEAIGGDEATAKRFHQRALSYRNLFNPATGFIQPKRGGAWLEAFNPTEVNFNYTEANGWQYNFFAPHDIAGHIALMGGEAAYLERLLAMFNHSPETTGRDQADITGLIGQYAHGNEPSHHMAYLFNHVGRPDLTAKYVQQILSELYTDQPDGLSGNEDCGQMSAWYVWSAMGLYPVNPGSSIVEVGFPRFDRIVVHPADNRPSFEILATGKGQTLSALSFNNRPQGAFMQKRDLMAGGQLVMERSDTPSDWGTAPADRPVHRHSAAHFVPVPVVDAPRIFKGDSCTVRLIAPCSDCRTEWRDPTTGAPWRLASDSIVVFGSTTLEARTLDNSGRHSAAISHSVRQVEHDHKLVSITPFDNQYAAGGDQALVDGITGPANFKTGDWQGYFGTDVEAVVKLEAGCEVRALRIGALRDTRPWIFLPRQVSFEASSDGMNWTPLGIVGHEVPDLPEEVLVHRFAWSGQAPEPTTHIRAQLSSFGALPAVHLGAGNPSWMFLDELEIICDGDKGN
jgi:predicted alpha-1,2-mannosidase